MAPSYIKTNMTIKSYKNKKLKNMIANKNFLKDGVKKMKFQV